MARKLGEILADMVLYGDIEAAPIPDAMTSLPESKDDVEAYIRVSIAATLLKLTDGGEGGSCSVDDELVAPYLRQEVQDTCDHGTPKSGHCRECLEEGRVRSIGCKTE